MSAIPSSNLPGHRYLHDRVISALELCQESQDLEFKQSGAWEDLKYKIVRTALSMANRRDGGVIVVGVAERDQTWVREGMEASHLQTFDEDIANDFLNRYASPPMAIRFVFVEHESKQYLAVSVPEFERSPIICKKEADRELQKGAIYVRPPGKPRTTRAMEASEIAEVLELASEKLARIFLRQARNVGMRPPDDAERAFDAELGGL